MPWVSGTGADDFGWPGHPEGLWMSLFAAVHAPTAAGPLLWLGLQKVRRTPTARLALAYRLVPPRGCCAGSHGSPCCVRTAEQLPDGLMAANHAGERPRSPLPVARSLGENLLLDRILAGGQVGDALPLANLRIEAMAACLPLGLLFDATA